MGSPKKVRVRARTRDSFRLPPSSRPQTSSTNKMAKGSGSKKAKKSGSNVFALFSQRQIQEFKEAFGIMDADKDGLLSSGDIVAAFNSVGKSVSDGEAQGMLSEAPGPVNFTQMVMLFAEKMAGGADDDDTILKAFDAFEVNGKIDADMFKHSLMTSGDKFTSAEVDNAFGEFSIEDGMIDAVQLKGLMVSKKEEGEEPNKRVSPNLSYQRHHLIRISSCHKTTSKKKTKKRILLKKKIHPIETKVI